MNTEYIALIPFLILMVAFALLNSAGKKKFGAFLQALDKKEYNLKDVMPAGFALMDAVHYDYTSGLDRTLRRQLAELYPAELEAALDTLDAAIESGRFTEAEADWARLLRLYLVTPIDDRNELPRTPADMQ